MFFRKSLEDSIQKVLVILQQMRKINPQNVIETTSLNEKLTDSTKNLHNAIRKHYNIASFFRPLVKALASSDDRFGNYARQYSEKFSDSLARGFKLLSEPNFDNEKCYELLKFSVEHSYE